MALKIMMIRQHTKFHYKKLSGSEDIMTKLIFPVDLNPHRDLNIKDSDSKLSHNTPAHDHAPLYQIWLQMVQKYIYIVI